MPITTTCVDTTPSIMDDRSALTDPRETHAARLPSINLKAGRSFRDVILDLNTRLKNEITQSGEDGFGWPHYLSPEEQVMPKRWTWIACYAVKGGSEGYWVHIDLILADRQHRQNLGMTKVWSWHAALTLANAATRILHEY